MRLTLFAATGRVGRLVLTEAIGAGHQVTAVARDPRLLGADVPVVAADLAGPPPEGLLADSVRGADAVLSCLGARTRADAGVAAQGTRAIVAAMNAVGARRLVVISAGPVGTIPTPGRPAPPRHDPGDGFFTRHLLAPIVRRIFRPIYADLAEMEEIVRDSGLEWTIVRPPRLLDRSRRSDPRLRYGENVRGGLSVSRATVARVMLASLTDPSALRQTIGLAD